MNHRKSYRGVRTWARHCAAAVLLAASVWTLSPPLSAQEPAEVAADGTPSQEAASNSVAEPENATEFVGEMYQIGLGWHAAALEGLPTDKFGLVDWVAALDQGLIEPRGSVQPDVPEGMPFDMNILMPSKTGMIAGAYFPHKTHTTWMSCDSCHIKIFMPLAGSNDLTMSTIVKGQACGVCHGKVAFPLNDCTRCHISQSDADRGDEAGQ
jgi:c(7)-type cytochrome triheme protein